MRVVYLFLTRRVHGLTLFARTGYPDLWISKFSSATATNYAMAIFFHIRPIRCSLMILSFGLSASLSTVHYDIRYVHTCNGNITNRYWKSSVLTVVTTRLPFVVFTAFRISNSGDARDGRESSAEVARLANWATRGRSHCLATLIRKPTQYMGGMNVGPEPAQLCKVLFPRFQGP